MIEKLRERIQEVATVSEALWNEIQLNAEIVSLKKNEILIPYGAKDKNVYVILSGCLESSLRMTSGKSHSVWFYFEHFFDVVVAMDSYFMDEPTKYQFRALESTTVVIQEKTLVDSLLERYLSFNQFFRYDIAYHLALIYEINAYRLTHAPLDFFSYLNTQYNALFYRIPANKMADFIGISPEWFSKLQRRTNS
ncbi:MAG: cyclic nucleotide-binding domain-containing protein [Bacteroidota bacterium]|nr:cyclic nucleotide-binding domain-containing protein [uncultured Allomuricauda sp.]